MPNTNLTEYEVTIWSTENNMDLKTWTFTNEDEAIAKRSACVCGPSTTLERYRHVHEYYITVDWTLNGLGAPCDDIDTLFAHDVFLTD